MLALVKMELDEEEEEVRMIKWQDDDDDEVRERVGLESCWTLSWRLTQHRGF